MHLEEDGYTNSTAVLLCTVAGKPPLSIKAALNPSLTVYP
jgi:hypothetical protein